MLARNENAHLRATNEYKPLESCKAGGDIMREPIGMRLTSPESGSHRVGSEGVTMTTLEGVEQIEGNCSCLARIDLFRSPK